MVKDYFFRRESGDGDFYEFKIRYSPLGAPIVEVEVGDRYNGLTVTCHSQIHGDSLGQLRDWLNQLLPESNCSTRADE